MASRCNANTLNPATMPYWSNKLKRPPSPPKPSSPFDELLKPCPRAAQAFPNSRPKKLSYYVSRDAVIKEELTKLSSGVVFDTHGHELGFSLQDVLGFARRTKLVQPAELSIGRLAKDQFLIILPHGLAPETFINATTPELWDAGFSFQPWSKIDGAKLILPEYKVLIDLNNIPPHLFKEEEVRKLVSTFGIYVTSVAPKDIADLSVWSVIVAVNRLENVPEEIAMYDLGFEHRFIKRPTCRRCNLDSPSHSKSR